MTRDCILRCRCDECERTAAFWTWNEGRGEWMPICDRHLVGIHPSLERMVWLESGFAKPIEVSIPTEPPPRPTTPRSRMFYDAVIEAMGWQGRGADP